MIYANIVDGKVHEIVDTDDDIKTLYHPDLIYIKCDESVCVGHIYAKGKFSAPNDALPALTREEIEAQRLMAYANPVTGSDRYFSEALSMQAQGAPASSTEVKDTAARGLARKLEIQAELPYPKGD